MNILGAITILEEIEASRPLLDFYGWQDALRLGIEALKRVKANRGEGRVVVFQALPGETEE